MQGRNFDYPVPLEGYMAQSYLWQIENDARDLRTKLRPQDELPGWVNAYVAQTADRISQASRYMQFKISQYSTHDLGCGCSACWGDAYGWASQYPESVLTRSGTAQRLGISNAPTATARANLSKVSDFLATLPVPVEVTSGYRSPAVNERLTPPGSRTSQHMSGEAVDFVPQGMTREQVAAWLWQRKANIPGLDQVILYTNSTHMHVSIGPRNRKQFLQGPNGGPYIPWIPPEDLLRFVGAGAAASGLSALVVMPIVGALTLGAIYFIRRRSR